MMRYFLLMSTALCGVTLSSTAYAQSNDAEHEPTETTDMDEITSYGTTNPIAVFDYPGQVSVITREEIEIFAPSSISDALRDVPGVEFSGGPRRTGETPSIRGRGGENVLILLDGARQSFISAHDGRFFLDPDLIKSAEVVKGPASSLYGSGAVGGVLAFETIDAADLLQEGETSGIRLRLGYQSVNEDALGTLTGYTQQGNLDLVGSFGLRSSGDIELGSGATLPSDDDIQNYLVKAGYALSDDLRIEGSWQRFENTAIEPNNGQGTAIGNDVEKDISTDTFRVNAIYNPTSNGLINTTLTAYKTNTSVEEFDQSLPRTTLRDIQTTGLGIRNASSVNLGGIETIITIGGDWYKDEQVGTDDNNTNGTRNGVPDGEAEFYGAYAQAEARLDISDTLDLLVIPGIRYDSFDSNAVGIAQINSDNAWSPRLGVSLGSDNVRAFGSYAKGFRAPSINELYLDGVHFPIPHPILFNPQQGSFVFVNNNFAPNPDLIPEKAETFEGGLSLNFDNVIVPGDKFQGKTSYYTSDVTDLINIRVNFAYDATCFAVPFQPCTAGTTNSANLDNAELSGFELEGHYESGRIAMRATYSAIEGSDKSNGEDLGILTPNRFTMDTRVKAPEWDAAVGVRLQVVSDFERRDFDAASNSLIVAETRDGYASVDLYATWKPQFVKGVRLDVGVDNVFDTDYARVFEGVSEPGLNLKAAVSFQKGF
jgi:hemoglobin/transferrin/lactoferrin receptor protein